MDGTLVFIFLLDQLPENILNKTLETVELAHTEYSAVQQCGSTITDPLLQLISRELEVLMIPKWLADERRQNSLSKTIKHNNFNKTYETNLKTNKVIQSSFETEVKYTVNGHDLDKNEPLNEKDISDEDSKVQVKPPLLAAIFESLLNITAQTCGGTVVAPQWVLTAASCVNLLSNLNAESTNVTEQSTYTVVVNATDPLIDGSAHNVTEIHLHPKPTTDVNSKKPIVALMKITPAVGLTEFPTFIHREDSTQHVTVYGWSMMKKSNNSDHDTMLATAFDALILTPQDCSTHYNITEDAKELCLATTDEYSHILSQLSWGGPVVSRKGGIVGVSRGDSAAPLAAWPVAAHVRWIHDTATHDTTQ